MVAGIALNLAVVVLLALLMAAATRRFNGIEIGTVLVLKKFEVSETPSPSVVIEGRPSGLIAWVMTVAGLDTLTRLTVDEKEIRIRRTSLSGEVHHVVPVAYVSSSHCGYGQPIGLLILAAVVALGAVVVALKMGNSAMMLLSGLLVAAILAVTYVFQRKITVSIETRGGMVLGVAFKPSAIEGVHVNLKKGLRTISIINNIIVRRSSPAGGAGSL